jgi:CBS domain-containing protein
MLPAFPMDGGRVVRGLLATRLHYARATRIAAGLGQFMAFVFVFVGLFLFFNPFLLFIALFVWIGAAQEANYAEIRSVLGGVPVAHAMLTDFKTLSPDDSLGIVIELILAGSQTDFPVVEDGRVAGVLTRGDLLVALAKEGQFARVRDVMRTDFRTLDSYELLDSAFAGLQSSECRTVPVTRNGQLVGIINLENIGEYVMIKNALEEASRTG